MNTFRNIVYMSLVILLFNCTRRENDIPGTRYKFANEVSETMNFVPLKPGDIKPAGWLYDWADKAAHGITGQLDKRAVTFEKGWTGASFEARGVKEEGTNWPLEQSAYWLDGLVRLAYILDDSTLIQKAKSRLDPIIDGVLDGGPSFIYWRPKEQLNKFFDNWAHSHIGRAMVAYYMASGEQKVLEALLRVYRDYPLPKMSPYFHPVNGAVNVDPMLETYLISGDSTIRNNLLSYSQKTSLQSTTDKWMNGEISPKHTVIYYENIRVPGILYTVAEDQRLLEATKSALEWGKMEHGLPLGLISGEEFSAGIGSTRNIETCNVAAGAWTINWLLKITGNANYGDQLEQIFFNTGPAPVDKDFNTMCYYQSPNRLNTGFPEDEPSNPGPESYRFTKTGHNVLCCVGNVNRIIPNYIMHMWMKPVNLEGIAATLYGPNVLTTTIKNVPVKIETKTNYPFQENIKMMVDPKKNVKFKVLLRIPMWCNNPSVKINGNTIDVVPDQNGFVSIERRWKQGDVIDIMFPMTVQLIKGKTTEYPNIPYFKEKEEARRLAKTDNIIFPYGSVKYGPLLFSLPIPDNGPNELKEQVPFNYALHMDEQNLNDEIKVKRSPMPDTWEWSLKNIPLQLTVPALKIDWQPEEIKPLPESPIKDGENVNIDLIPYGLTKFRVTMFPVSSKFWN